MLAVGWLTAPMGANAAYWNLFNFEGESAQSAQFVTYATLADMLGDTNRTGLFTPNAAGAGDNIVGSGSDEMRSTNVSEPNALFLVSAALAALGFARRRYNQK
jgi:hypothetical protein